MDSGYSKAKEGRTEEGSGAWEAVTTAMFDVERNYHIQDQLAPHMRDAKKHNTNMIPWRAYASSFHFEFCLDGAAKR